MLDMISYYNIEVNRFKTESSKNSRISFEEFVSKDPSRIQWDQGLMEYGSKAKQIEFSEESMRIGLYRPYCKQHVYFDKNLNWSRNQLPSLFPSTESINKLICISGSGVTKDFSCLITDCIPDRQMQFNGQCFPLFLYEDNGAFQGELFESNDYGRFLQKGAINDWFLSRAHQLYGKTVTSEDLFYFVYGFLHDKNYREVFAVDLRIMLPRLPLPQNVGHFWAFSKAGRQLAELHLNYETVAPSSEVTVTGDSGGDFTVTKMRFPKKEEKETILFNNSITLRNIPIKAYDYVVNGKSAIEWVMERYQVSTHKESGIVNDPNDWAKDVGNPRYILDLLLSVINVSVQTVDIVNSLPKVDFSSMKA
jgi:predicted helicase